MDQVTDDGVYQKFSVPPRLPQSCRKTYELVRSVT